MILDQPDVRAGSHTQGSRRKQAPGEECRFSCVGAPDPGFTGADLANMLNEAAILAARRNKRRIGMMNWKKRSTELLPVPERRSRVISERKGLVAYHEARPCGVRVSTAPCRSSAQGINHSPRPGRWLYPQPAERRPVLSNPVGAV